MTKILNIPLTLFLSVSLIVLVTGGCSSTAPIKVHVPGNESEWNGMLGRKNAPLTITVFQDLGCGMCRIAYEQQVGAVKEKYVDTGLARYVFREFPLGFQKRQVELARGAKCAAKQGKYLPFTGFLLINKKTVSPEKLVEYAKLFSLDTEKFKSCLGSPESLKAVRIDYDEGRSLGIGGTPSYVMNGFLFAGALSQSDFLEVIEEQLKQ